MLPWLEVRLARTPALNDMDDMAFNVELSVEEWWAVQLQGTVRDGNRIKHRIAVPSLI